jgi:hypothetical protein
MLLTLPYKLPARNILAVDRKNEYCSGRFADRRFHCLELATLDGSAKRIQYPFGDHWCMAV